ncbi:hypothetical protein [Limimaricola pyoseonensis]|uniref:Uncharacterized protein n=1 Tax=Limimaricola pyoseonensis TaxID=521013 RepID=A0A1G7GPN7_9RHOB|nr:hypothetical protein [Limimaricola pyoseonensis]SDE90051.1 hypothetical protein SAMN04488567_2870 [Limimaricola pyoseonensis]
MPLSFPISLAGFFGPAAIAQATFHLAPALKQNRTRGGAIIRTGYATRLWHGLVSVSARSHAAMAAIEAKADWLLEANGSFLVTPKHMPTSGTPTCSIASTSGLNQMAFGGLPANYRIPAGSFFATAIASGGRTIRHMHRVLEDAVANAQGVTPSVSILAPLEQHEDPGATVYLASPVIEAVVATEDFSPVQASGALSDGLSFRWVQKL